jgi:DUF2971 family protein
MKLYKYRSNEFWDRDSQGLIENYFWAAKYDSLNDPTESLFNSDDLKKDLFHFELYLQKNDPIYKGMKSHETYEILLKKMRDSIEGIGIISLSKTYNDELLWSYYSNSHRGYCIEYDESILFQSYDTYKINTFDVRYENEPPNLSMEDFHPENKSDLLQYVLGTKSFKWKHEAERRIVTDSIGKYPHNINAITGIFFGVNSSEELIQEIIEKTKYNGIKYYKMKLIENTYIYEKELIETEYSVLKRNSVSGVEYEIEIDLDRIFNKGFAKITLDNEVNKEDLDKVANELKAKYFICREIITIHYYLKNQSDESAWASSNWMPNSTKFQNIIN